MTDLKYASAFSGIEGFGYAWDGLGMTPTMQIELNKYRRQILERHWPDTPRGADIHDISGADLGKPDIFVGGFPCKNLSIGKGHRTGLDSTDSGLYWEFQRLAGECIRLVDATRPRWCVLENVPGLLGFNEGRDMAAVVLGLEDLGYGWAYRVVDSNHVGSAQRRPRVIVVAHRGGDPRPAWLVLADREASAESLALCGEQAGSELATASRGIAPAGVEWFRKSARPRGKASEGHWASWVESPFFNVITANDGLNVSKKGVPTVSAVKQTHLVLQDDRLRGLTPVEWERLQGFPDGWTEGIPEAEQYYALGDAMNVPLARWLGRRLIEVDTALPLLPEAIAA